MCFVELESSFYVCMCVLELELEKYDGSSCWERVVRERTRGKRMEVLGLLYKSHTGLVLQVLFIV